MQLHACKHGSCSASHAQQRSSPLIRPQGHILQRNNSYILRRRLQRASTAVTAANATQQKSAPPGPLRGLHPPPNPQGAYHIGQLKVSNLHTMHYYQYGNPQGLPAVFLHGGPGAAAWPNHARFFDLRVWRVVLLDQRGCGASTPRGCLVDNSTESLVSDLEALRAHLEIPSWLVLGGSWGVALGLAYASAFPQRVSGLVLRGICMMRPQEIDWMYRPGGASLLRPMGWAKFVESLPEELRQGSVLHGYLRQLTSSNPSVRDAAARSWMDWGFSVGGGSSKAALVWDGSAWSWSQHPLPQSPKSWGKRPEPSLVQQHQQQQQQQQPQQQVHAAANGTQQGASSRRQQGSGRGRKGGSRDSGSVESTGRYGSNGSASASSSSSSQGLSGEGGVAGVSGVNGDGNGRGASMSSRTQSPVAAAASPSSGVSSSRNGSNGSSSSADGGSSSSSSSSNGSSSSSSVSCSQEGEILEAALQFMGDNAMPSTTAQALLECAYSAAYGFGLHRHPLLAPDRIASLQAHGVRCIAIQGEMDLICPPANVWDLHRAWPQMQVVIVPEAGHSQYDPRITHELVCAVEHMQRDIQGR